MRRRARRRPARGRASSTSGVGSCSTSATGRPTTDCERQPGDRLGAAWLNVRMRCCRSVVARPLGRLSMTCWLSACRSAISVDACSSRAPADRTLSASEPLSSATAKNPNTFSATVYCATAAAAATTRPADSHGSMQKPGRRQDTARRRGRRRARALSVATSRPPRRNWTVLAATIGSTYSDEKKLVTPPVK